MKTLAVAAALAFSACARPGGGPPEIHYGRDACSRCGMIVSEERFASGYVGPDGETVAFDDVGELLAAISKNPSLGAQAYVHDARDGRWLRASQAVFVKLPGLATPMGSGYAAFSSEAGAREFARGRGAHIEGAALTLASASR